MFIETSVSEPHQTDAAPGKNFDAAPAPTLLYSYHIYTKPTFFKQAKVNIRVRAIFAYDFF
jgi:hypothetical protein